MASQAERARSIQSGRGFYRIYALVLICAGFFLSYADRQIFGVLMTPMKAEFGLSDTQLGLISGLAFGFFYAVTSLPLAHLADRGSRKNVLAVCLLLWSGATMLSGAATNGVHLLFARMSVAIGEAGGTPASISAISDLFSRARRGLAIACYNASGSLGGGAVAIIGAWVASEYGWRMAFLALGVPGIALAILVAFTMREPVRGASDGLVDVGPPVRLKDTLLHIWRQPVLVFAILGGAASSGVVACTAWLPSLFQRSHHMSLVEAGGAVAIGLLVSGPFGEIIGGQMTDRLGRRGTAPILYAVAAISAATVAAGLAMVLSPTVWVAVLLMILWKILATVFPPPTWTLSQTLVEQRMRATAQSVTGLCGHLFGYGTGPAFVGLLSELYRPAMGEDSLRWGLATVFVVIGAIATGFYWLGARAAMRGPQFASQ